MTVVLIWTAGLVNVTLVPLLLVGVLRKGKAAMQTRRGAPVWQPFYDLAKLLRKGETVSEVASWVFAWAPRLSLWVALLAALMVPWAGLPAPLGARVDLIVLAYLLAFGKFFVVLAALDTGSAFGGLGASREVTVSLLVEPIAIVGLGSLAVQTGSLELATVYAAPISPLLAGLVGSALVVAGLAELSRMPVDDPTTHLELTMVHEALILENSGRNLALVELGVALRTGVFLGLAVQTLLRTWPGYLHLEIGLRYGVGLLTLFAAALAVAVTEGVLVKLNWRRVPHFIAFGLGLSLLAALVVAAGG
jgi:formate hydrogenlyase subunit 4